MAREKKLFVVAPSLSRSHSNLPNPKPQRVRERVTSYDTSAASTINIVGMTMYRHLLIISRSREAQETSLSVPFPVETLPTAAKSDLRERSSVVGDPTNRPRNGHLESRQERRIISGRENERDRHFITRIIRGGEDHRERLSTSKLGLHRLQERQAKPR